MPVPFRILVIDDEPGFCTLVTRVLTRDGDSVASASTGGDGIAMFHGALARGEPVQVVVTDLTMGPVNGMAVAAEVKAAAPGTFVVLVTGTTVGSPPIPNIDLILQKPFRFDELRRAIRKFASRRSEAVRRS